MDGSRRKVYQVTQSQVTIEVGQVPAGVYVLMIQGDQRVHKQLIVVSE